MHVADVHQPPLAMSWHCRCTMRHLGATARAWCPSMLCATVLTFEQLQHTNTCLHYPTHPSLATQSNLSSLTLISSLSLQIRPLPGRLSTVVIRDTCLMTSVRLCSLIGPIPPSPTFPPRPSLSQIHNKFKDLVDQLLTEFITEMGVNPQEFYDVIATQHESDKLTGFVVQTILTVDDFLLFKAMMVKRNIDLTNQVRVWRAERGMSRKGVSTLGTWVVCQAAGPIPRATQDARARAVPLKTSGRKQFLLSALSTGVASAPTRPKTASNYQLNHIPCSL